MICSGPSSGARLAKPVASAGPNTSCIFSGSTACGSQPVASSAVIARFLSPSAATQIGMSARRGWLISLSALPSPVPWSGGSGTV